MKKGQTTGWTTATLVTAGSIAVLRMVLSLPGAALAATVGMPYASGALTFLIQGMLVPFTCLLIRRFGAATTMGFVYGVLTIPLPIGGPSGFSPKVLLPVVFGLLADSLYALLKRYEKLTAIAIGAGINGLVPPVGFLLWSLLGLPGMAEAARASMTPFILVVTLVMGGIVGYLGYLIYQKIKNTAVVRRIQGKREYYFA